MLSTVQIFAAGSENTETMELVIDGEVAQSWSNIGGNAETGAFQVFSFETANTVTPGQIRVQLASDVFDPAAGIDENLRVDAITIDGVRYETESPDVFSTGTWKPEDGIVPGFRQDEVLHATGYFQFADPSNGSTTNITINARGSVGGETFNLRIDDQVVASFEASTSFEAFEFSIDRPIGPENVSVEFTNDLLTEEFDRNLIVDNISIDGETFESEGSGVFSTGTWLQGSIEPGFGRGEVLHANGFFRYGVSAESPTDDLTIVARGDEGSERFDVLVNREVVAEFQINGTGPNTFVIENAGVTDPSQVRIEFSDDVFDPNTGIDNNLEVDFIQLGDQRIETDSSDVYTSGTWVPGRGRISGFGIGGRLDTVGSIQFGVGVESELVLATEFSVAQPISGFGQLDNRPFASRPDGATLVGILQNPQDSNLTSVVQLVGTDGNVDTSFGVGAQTLGVAGEIIEIAVSGDNSFYVRTDTAITRFSAAGERLFNFPLTEVDVEQIATDSDGNLILADYENGIVVSRLSASGGLDESFQGGSVTISSDRLGSIGSTTDIEILRDGRIAISASLGRAFNLEAAIALVDENGDLVTSFGDGGVTLIDEALSAFELTSDSEGRIYLEDSQSVFRLTANGQLDETWSNNGRLDLFDRLQDFTIRVDNQDRLLVATEVTNFVALEIIGVREDAILAMRFNEDGTPDVEFGDGGRQVKDGDFGGSVDIDLSGNLLVNGVEASASTLDRVRFFTRFLIS